jgi:glutamyl-tRNA synthetase
VSPQNEWLKSVVCTLQERSKTLVEMAEAMNYYFAGEIVYQEKAAKKILRPVAADILEELLPHLEPLESFDPQTLETVIHGFMEEKALKLVKVAQPIRVAITGGSASPGLFDVMALLGKEIAIRRIRQAIEWIRTSREKIS